MKVPFYDLTHQNSQVKDEVISGWQKVIDGNSFILGEEVAKFEAQLAKYYEAQFALGVGNGTDAIEILLRSLNLRADSAVMLPANTFIATPLAVIRAGLRVKLVDPNPGTMLLDVNSLSVASSDFEALVPVHLYGQMCDVESISSFVGKDIPIIEDAAQSQGASFKGDHSGKHSIGAATSFYPGKNLGAFGDAGGIVTSMAKVYESCLAIRNYGSPRKYYHPVLGFNSRLDSVQAVVLSAKLSKLKDFNDSRRKLADNYMRMLSTFSEIRLPETDEQAHHVWHLFVIRVANRDKIADLMLKKGVQTIIHYPKPVHLQESLEFLGYNRGDFPVAEDISENCLSLPLFPGMTDEQQEYVVSCLIDALELVL